MQVYCAQMDGTVQRSLCNILIISNTRIYIYILNSKEYKQSCNDGVNTKGFLELHFFEHYKYTTIKPFSSYHFFGTNLHHHEKTARCAFNHKPISYTNMSRTQTRPRDYQQSQQHLLETSYTRS